MEIDVCSTLMPTASVATFQAQDYKPQCPVSEVDKIESLHSQFRCQSVKFVFSLASLVEELNFSPATSIAIKV